MKAFLKVSVQVLLQHSSHNTPFAANVYAFVETEGSILLNFKKGNVLACTIKEYNNLKCEEFYQQIGKIPKKEPFWMINTKPKVGEMTKAKSQSLRS